ncbi:hypothetical protein GQ54DRAFT_176642 [Martensiomyces pterosporus]|nr:hypothetical protein GQ54DRAFT_176642 [Martensiomyces pterosporus]
MEILDPYNPRNNIRVKGITNFEVSVKLFFLPAATDTSNRPSPLYVRQALACVQKQLGAVKIDEFFVSFVDISSPDNSSLHPDRLPSGSTVRMPLHTSDPYTLDDIVDLDSGSFSSRGRVSSARSSSVNGTGGTASGRSNSQNADDANDDGSSVGSGSNDDSNEGSQPNAEAIDITRYLKVWRNLNKLRASGEIGKLGLCDFTLPQLQQLVEASQLKPDMLQVKVSSDPTAAILDERLHAYAKENSISIRTHTDSLEILTDRTFQTLAADFKINERFPTTEVPPQGYKVDVMRPRWVANYSVSLKNRGLVANRGYIVMASSDCVLDPNRISHNAYAPQ